MMTFSLKPLWARGVAMATLGLACTAAVSAAEPPPFNPYLSAPVYGTTHVDASQSDAFPYPVAAGQYRVDLGQLQRIDGGPVNIMAFASATPGFMWALSTDRIAYVDARDGRWQSLGDMGLPGVVRRTPQQLQRLVQTRYTSLEQAETVIRDILGPYPAAAMTAGLYSVVDRDNLFWVASRTRVIGVGLKDPAQPSAGIEIKRSFDLDTVLEHDEIGGRKTKALLGMGLTWDGQLVVGATNAVVVLDREFKREPVMYRFPATQFASNAFAIDERNGIYVATGSKAPRQPGRMHKLVWTGGRLSDAEADGGWVAEYEGGDWPPAIKAGTGTGSTPTLMGFGPAEDHLVVLTDGANRMNLVAFWRDAIPADFAQQPGTRSRRIAGQLPITAGQPADAPWIQSEQSVSVVGYGAFVINNVVTQGHPDKIIDVMTMGPLHAGPYGTERAEWDPKARRLRSVWTRGDVSSVNMVPIVSRGSNMVFVNGYYPDAGWDVTGLDWATGKTVFRTVFGQGHEGNGAYAILQFLPNGDLLFNSVAGPYRVPLSRPHPAVTPLAP